MKNLLYKLEGFSGRRCWGYWEFSQSEWWGKLLYKIGVADKSIAYPDRFVVEWFGGIRSLVHRIVIKFI